jgi:hypothetical protein
MGHPPTNGNGSAATILPPTKTVITGVSLVHRRLTKAQRAVLAANVIDGLARYVPTNQRVYADFGMSQPYVDIARRLTPQRREAILRGWDQTSFAELMNPPRQLSLAGPLTPNMKVVTDADLEQMIRAVGLERALAVACTVEHNT